MARQKLGQHFLISSNILERIALAACGERTELAVEIGPGKGALTEHLLTHASRVAAIELDSALAEHLKQRWPNEGRLEIVQANAIESDWSRWGEGVLAGNLPYYLATPIVSRYVRDPGLLRHAVFLVQKEVAERISARPGTRDYGYFSVECQLLSRVEYLFAVPPGAFRPPPKVDSAVIRLTPVGAPSELDTREFLRFVSACFRQKRKMLRNNLTGIYAREVLDADFTLTKRAEQLSVAELLELFKTIEFSRLSCIKHITSPH